MHSLCFLPNLFFQLGSPVNGSNHLDLSPRISPSRLLYLLATAESTVKHPIASAIVNLVRIFRQEFITSQPDSKDSNNLATTTANNPRVDPAHEFGDPLQSTLNATTFEFAQVCLIQAHAHV